MSAKDHYHELVKNALIKDGWTITHDPYTLYAGQDNVYADLGAEKELISAVKDAEKIAVEIKSFIGRSDISQLQKALGQYLIYQAAIRSEEPERKMYLAVPTEFEGRFLNEIFWRRLLKRIGVNMIIYDTDNATITQWIRQPTIDE